MIRYTIPFQTATNPVTMIQCPDCSGEGYGIYCQRCGGTRWIIQPDPITPLDITPPTTITISSIDPTLWAFLTRLEAKLDRLLAALDGEQ